jgi:uncharacterized protein YcnI
MRTSKLASLLLTLVLLAAFSLPLLAHASVNPRTAPAGVHHMLFYVRAPVEQAIPVIELGYEVSEEWRNNGGDVNSFQDMPGWTLHVEFDDEGKVERFFWTDGEAPRETFQMVYVSMNVPEEPGEYPFIAWQKYADGKVVRFNEPRGEGVEFPYPIVTVESTPILTAGTVQVSAIAIALIALAISLLSFKGHGHPA